MNKILSGAKWSTISTMTIAFSQILRLSILTRFLDKSDFGIVAIITFILGLTQVFGDLGFTVAVMHKKEVTKSEFSSVFWVQLLIFTLIYFILILFSSLFAEFYKQPTITTLMPIALLDIIFWGIGKLYDTILQKQMKFRVIAIRSIMSSLLSLLLAWLLAYWGFGIYSLILSTLFYSGFNNVWNFILGQKEYKIQFHVLYSEVKPFLSIGLYKTGAQILDYFSGKLDIIIIGRFLGTDVLGIYSLSKELVLKIAALVNIIVIKVALPYFVTIQDDIKLLQIRYCEMVRLFAFLNFPICSILFVFSNYIVVILYGSDYIYAGKLISLLAFYVLINGVSSSEGILVAAMGKTYLGFKWTVIRVFVTMLAITISAQYSIELIIFSQILVAILGFFYVWRYIIYELIFLKFYHYLRSFIGLMMLSIFICALFTPVVKCNIFNVEGVFLELLFYGLSFCVIYFSTVLVLYKKQIAALYNTLSNKKRII